MNLLSSVETLCVTTTVDFFVFVLAAPKSRFHEAGGKPGVRDHRGGEGSEGGEGRTDGIG